ncbi:helix-turn-helix domain-containing protein [Streptomyces bangladeshensis]|uniref:HTH araC/xylS-type domain-containing protein n=1 Tax=Streptomyces bangladeshensis TaxID=295352 RepID=A0ABN3BIX9_9ACTN
MTPVIDTTRTPEGGYAVRRRRRAPAVDALPVTAVPCRAPAPQDRMTTVPLRHLLCVTVDVESQFFAHGLRRFAHEAGRAEGFVVIAVMGAPGAVLRHADRAVRLATGTLVLWDAERPPVIDHPRGVEVKACLVPRRALAVHGAPPAEVAATALDGDGPLAALVASLLVSLTESAAVFSERVAGALAWSFTGLVATLITERCADDRAGAPDSGHHRTGEIYAYIDRHLGDPELSPGRIAAAHNMSLRALHKLFETEGITISRLIQRRRLQECARVLARGDSPGTTIAGVARRWGFTSSAHFSRAFRTAYGMSPSEWRDTRAGTEPPGWADGTRRSFH